MSVSVPARRPFFPVSGYLSGIIVSILVAVTPCLAADWRSAVPVVVASAGKHLLAPQSRVAGSVISRHDANVATEIEGRVIWLAEIGSRFSKNDILARLENSQQDLRLQEASANVLRAEARHTFLDREVKRLKKLASENNTARTLLDQTVADRDVAVAELKLSRAQFERSRDLNNRQMVRAPFAGMVARQLLQTGEWAGVGTALLRLVDPDMLEIQAMVPLSAHSFLHPGATVIASDGDQQAAGTVRRLAIVGDTRSRMLAMRIDFDNPGWVAGQALRVAVPSAKPRQVIAVPRDALVLRRDGAALYRIKDDASAERVVVKTGIAQGNMIEVLGDIHDGDKIVVRGGERLRPGQRVRILDSGSSE